MEEDIYQMSATENILVLLIIGLWLFAVISLVRKLERICNPPSIFVNYSLHNKTSLSPSTLHQRYPTDSIQSTRPSHIHFIRAISEPTIDTSPRTTIDFRSPSETCLRTKSSLSEQLLSPSTLDSERSNSSLYLPRHSGYRIHVETITNPTLTSKKLLYPKRIPSLVRNSLLNLHRHALSSHTISTSSISPGVIITTTENRIITPSSTGSIMKKKYQRGNAVDEDDSYTSKIIEI
jgi:hypothetical protein